MERPGIFIKIDINDGNPTSVKVALIDGWVGQAVAFPRNRLSGLKKNDKLSRPGVYFLLTSPRTIGEVASVYVGESENVYDRLIQHKKSNDSWNEAMVFTSMGDFITKAHARYLESRLLEMVKAANRYECTNTQTPKKPRLPESAEQSLEWYIYYMRVLVRALGHNLLEPMFQDPIQSPSDKVQEKKRDREPYLFLKYKNLEARGIVTDEGFLVFSNAQMTHVETSTIPSGSKKLREQYLISGKVDVTVQPWLLTEDTLFSSSSSAASFLTGGSRNGRTMWYTVEGLSLKELEGQSE